MSFGTGHIMDMVNRLKQNRAMRSSNRSTFKENSIISTSENGKKRTSLKFKTISSTELEKRKYKIQQQAAKVLKRERILLVIFVLILIVFTYSAIFWW